MFEGLARTAKAQGKLLFGFIGSLWIIQVVNAIAGGALIGLGIHPRALSGLWGVLFAPFIHVNFGHLIANTVPLLVLGWLVLLRSKRVFLGVSALAALVGGIGTWLIGPAASVHVGASILVFGYLGHLLARGVFERRFWPIVASVIVFFLYGGALFGILPGQAGISWQGHLFGLLGGVLAARAFRGHGAPQAKPVERRPATPRARIATPVRDDRAAEGEAAEIEAELRRKKRMQLK